MKIKRFTAMSAACMLLCTSFVSCGDSSNDGGNYSPYTGKNENNIADESPAEYNYDDAAGDSADYEASEDGADYYEEPEFFEEYEEEAPMPSYDEEYKNFIETGFKDPKTEPLSTFSADVDTASYSNVRRLIEDGMKVPEDAVRIEEFINYFDYDYPAPDDGRVFSKYTELADCPWNENNKLMMVGIQGKKMEEVPPSNLVFLIDSSGSMASYDKLPLVQTAFSMLAEKLTPEDRISIATYSGSSRIVLAGAEGNQKDEILEALYSITASGGTNGEGGIEAAYKLAEEYFIEGGNNRIIIATDGDLNIGASTEDELVSLIEEKRDKGIYLSVLGFGTGNYKDARMEALADNGNGNFSYIDSVDEAQRVLVQEMSGTLFTIAKDVKIQVEFNPSQVKQYRLIGYDNRIMNAEDFFDDTKDAGEVGAGHSVTALYEIEPVNSGNTYHGIELEFASEHEQPLDTTDNGRTEICKFSIAYQAVGEAGEIYDSQLFGMEKYSDTPSDKIRLAGAVAEFAMLLKNSQYKGSSSYDYILETVNELNTGNEKISELYDLVKTYYNS